MEKRSRERHNLSAWCRIAPTTNRRRTFWKKVENISGAGMLVIWSESRSDNSAPVVGETFTAELELPPNDVFGQRVMQFQTKVVRVAKDQEGRTLAALESYHCCFKSVRPGAWAQYQAPALVN